MSKTPKIVLLGAGSMSFGLNALRDLVTEPALRGATVTLVDIDRDKLESMRRLAVLLDARMNAGLRFEATVERRAALDGADFVLNATAIDRNRLWKLDYEIPRRHGVRHTLGENGGPGALFFTLRTLPLVFDIARDMEALCPDALLINFSNPESRIVMALSRHTRIAAVGLCHGLFMSRWAISKMTGVPYERLALWAMGLNHFQCVTQIRDRDTMEDLYPRLLEADQSHDPAYQPLTREMLRAFGYWLTCSDDHLGEYLAYGWEAGGAGYDFAADERAREAMRETLASVLAGAPPPAEWTTPSAERIAPVIKAVARNIPTPIESIVHRNGGTIPNLPEDIAVETPAMIDGRGVHPVSLGPLPDAIAKLMLPQASVQDLSVEAAVHARKDLALQALLVDPVTNSIAGARALLDELWEINRPYIRPCV